MSVDYNNIFIHAHACKLSEPIQLPANDIRLFFRGEDNKCLVADATGIQTNPAKYRFRSTITEEGYTDDYELNFHDSMADFGINSFGVFVNDNANNTHQYPLDYKKIGSVDLSVIIDNFHRVHNSKNFYLHICRDPCNKSKVDTPAKKKPKKKNKTPKKHKEVITPTRMKTQMKTQK